MKKAYGYLRVSGKGQVKAEGLGMQETAIREYAKANGIEIVQIFKEKGVSGTLESRPALAELLVTLEQNGHGVKTVLIQKIDRLSRDLMVQEGIIRDLKKNGFDLISAVEGPDLLSNDPTRKLIRQVLGAIAEYDKSMTVLKLRVARQRVKARTGKCEGRKTTSERDPALIAEIKKLRRKQKGIVKRMSFSLCAQILNENGFVNSVGEPLTGKAISGIWYRK